MTETTNNFTESQLLQLANLVANELKPILAEELKPIQEAIEIRFNKIEKSLLGFDDRMSHTEDFLARLRLDMLSHQNQPTPREPIRKGPSGNTLLEPRSTWLKKGPYQ